MKVNIYVEKEDKNYALDASSLKDIIDKLNINLQTVIITRNEELITESYYIKDGDTIKFLSVISGG